MSDLKDIEVEDVSFQKIRGTVQTQEGLKTKDIRSGAPELVGTWHEILNSYGYTDDIIEKIFIK